MSSSNIPISFRSAAAKAALFAFCLAAIPAAGCGSDNSGGSPDSGTTGSPDAGSFLRPDAASIKPAEGGAEASLTSMYDGTVGTPCASDIDCQPPGGPGLAICSLSLSQPIFPTPICVIPTCDPGTDGLVHFCDGPDDASSPGVCTQFSSTVSVCLPQCEFASDGTPPIGCTGHDACNFYTAGADQNNNLVGLGFCWGACTADADCPSGSSCQTNQGVCFTTVMPPTKTLGQACTSADSTSGACDCLTNPSSTSDAGFCSQACQVGISTDACPSGYVCQAFEPNSFTDSTTNQTTPGFMIQNTGLAGFCVPTCTAGDAGSGGAGETDASPASGDDGGGSTSGDASSGGGTGTGGGACPASTMCDTSTAAGATCLP
jgi:hypothetical protein